MNQLVALAIERLRNAVNAILIIAFDQSHHTTMHPRCVPVITLQLQTDILFAFILQAEPTIHPIYVITKVYFENINLTLCR